MDQWLGALGLVLGQVAVIASDAMHRIQAKHSYAKSVVILLVLAGMGFCVWSLQANELRFDSLLKGIEQRSFSFRPGTLSSPVRINAFRVDPKTYRFRAVKAASGVDTVHRIARKERLLLAVNASFFTPDGTPLGLIIDRGNEVQKLRNVDWGVFFITRDGKARIVHTSDFKKSDDIEVAIQSGPRLVVAGRPLKLKPQIARRTAVCVDTENRVLLVVTEQGILLQDFANLLALSTGEGGLGCLYALNLDGGSSTQATHLLPPKPWDLYGTSMIPVALGIQHRDSEVQP